MPRYAVFLRAINVGGRRVTMGILRGLVEGAGCSRVETLIASGNVVLESPLRSEPKLAAHLESSLTSALGFEVELFVRTSAEMAALAAAVGARPAVDGETLYLAFLTEAPPPADRRRVEAASTPSDTLSVRGRELLWSCRSGFRGSPFSGPALEKLLGVPATVRKSTTVLRMAAKLEAPGRR